MRLESIKFDVKQPKPLKQILQIRKLNLNKNLRKSSSHLPDVQNNLSDAFYFGIKSLCKLTKQINGNNLLRAYHKFRTNKFTLYK